MVYINLPGGTAPTWRLKWSIIPNICILISSVTLTRTPVNKAINQRRVHGGIRRGVLSRAVRLMRMNLFIPESITRGGTSFSKYLNGAALKICVYGQEIGDMNEIFSETGPRFIILFFPLQEHLYARNTIHLPSL